MSLASCVRERFSFSCMALSTGFLAPRFLRPSTVMMGSMGGLEAAGQTQQVRGGQSRLTRTLPLHRASPLIFVLVLSPSGLSVGGLFWTSFHQPGSPNSCAPERKKVGLPTDRQPATVLHHVDVFFLRMTDKIIILSASYRTRTGPVCFSAHWWPTDQKRFTCFPAGSSNVDR